MEFKRFNISEVNAERYYQLPKFLFEGELKKSISAEAKVLYALLRDRFNLSCKNGWANEKGEVYLIFTREEMCDMIGCGMQKIRRLISELKAAGLFEEEQVGQNMPNLIFLTYVDLDSGKLPSAENGAEADENSAPEAEAEKPCKPALQADCRKSTLQENITSEGNEFSQISENSQNEKSGLSKINTPDCRKSTPNKTNNNKTDIYNPSFILDKDKTILDEFYSKDKKSKPKKTYAQVLDETKEQIEYELVKVDYPSPPFLPNIVDSIAEIMADIRTTNDPYISVGKKTYATEVFRFKLDKLDCLDIVDMIERFNNLWSPPTNPRAYLTAMLYTAKIEAPFGFEYGIE